MSEATDRWHQDALVLRQVVRYLPRAGNLSAPVRLPIGLADRALAASNAEFKPGGSDSMEERALRRQSEALARIGQAVGETGRRVGQNVLVAIDPVVIKEAIAAARHSANDTGF
jgi:hypothetical protein